MNRTTKRKLEAFARFVEKIPNKLFNMGDWVSFPTTEDEQIKISKKNIHTCGSTCCLAGWEGIRRGYVLDTDGVATKKDENPRHVSNVARQTLCLNYEESIKLFYPGKWPRKQDDSFKFSHTPKGAAKRIRHLIRTGE